MQQLTAEAERESLHILVATRMMLATEKQLHFDQNNWTQACGTPCCTWGFTTMVCENLPTSPGNAMGQRIYNVSEMWWVYLTGVEDLKQTTRSRNPKSLIWYLPERHPGRDAAIARLDCIIQLKRNRLAALEVYEGEWGRPKRARNLPVGKDGQCARQKVMKTLCA